MKKRINVHNCLIFQRPQDDDNDNIGDILTNRKGSFGKECIHLEPNDSDFYLFWSGLTLDFSRLYLYTSVDLNNTKMNNA